MSKILLEKVNDWKIYFIIVIWITNMWGELKDELNQTRGDYVIVFHKWFFSDCCMIAAKYFEISKSLQTLYRWSTYYLNQRNMEAGFI